MTIIKHNQVDPHSHQLGTHEVEDLDQRAVAIVNDAEAAARAIIESAREEAITSRRAAEEQGYRDGEQRGLEAGREAGRAEAHEAHSEAIKSLNTSWHQALEGWERDRASMFRRAEDDVLLLAIRLAEQIVHRTAKIDGGVIRSQLTAALELVRHPTNVEIVVSPDDASIVSEIYEGMVFALHACRDVSMRTDPAVAPGGCLLQLEGGVIDATLDTQLKQMEHILLAQDQADTTGLSRGETHDADAC